MEKRCANCMKRMESDGVCPHCGFDNAHVVTYPHQLSPGTTLNHRYALGRVLGQGGFGITYVGLDTKLGLRVAVKEYFPMGFANRNTEASNDVTISQRRNRKVMEDGKDKFLKEARILAGFHDVDGIVSVRDYFEANQTAYIVMEYLEGQDLRRYIRNHRLSAEDMFAPFLPVMNALQMIHREGVIHRDISPDNIMRLPDGSLKLMDFGAARALDYASQKSVSVMLKAGYAPPEQYRSKGKLGPWTDIYALCATIYKCATGITPDDALERSEKDTIQWPSELGLPVSLNQENVLKKGLALKAERRFQSIEEMKSMLNLAPGASEAGDNSRKETDDDKTVYFDRNGKKKKRNPGIWKRVSATLCAVITILILAFMIKFSGERTEIPEEAQTPMYHATLTPGADMTVGDFDSALETLKGRLEVFADSLPFSVNVDGYKISLDLPQEAFGDLELEEVFYRYLSRPVALSFHDKRSLAPEYMPLSRSDLESVSLEFGKIDGADGAEHGFGDEDYPYLTITLSDDCIQRLGETIQELGENLRFSQDTNYGYYTFPTGDGKTFHVLNDDSGGRFTPLLRFNLTNDVLAGGFRVAIDIDSRTDWQNTAAVSLVGKFQANAEEMTEATVEFVLHSDNEASPGEIYDTEIALKSRLDALEIPYAFGFPEQKPGTNFAIRTPLRHMGVPILQILTNQSSFQLISGLFSLNLDASSIELSCEKQDDGSFKAFFTMEGESRKQTLEHFLRQIQNNGNEKIRLSIGGGLEAVYTPCIGAETAQISEDGTIPFSEFCLSENALINQDSLWFVNLITAIKDTQIRVYSLFLEAVQFYADADGVMPTSNDYEVFYPDDRKLLSEINSICKDMDALSASVRIGPELSDSGRVLSVYLHLDVDETLPERAATIAKAIYQNCGFSESYLSNMYVFPIEEDNYARERARIFFRKSYSNSGGSISVSGIFTGGRLDRYKARFREILQSDDFYRDSYDGWSFGV